MSYVKDNLTPNEKILYKARVHPAIFLPAIVFVVLGFILTFLSIIDTNNLTRIFTFVLAGMFFLATIREAIRAIIIIGTTEFAVTNKRVIAKWGFFHRRTLEMLLQKVESVGVYQSILGRMLNYGNVTVTGTGGTRERFPAIIDPLILRKKINQIIEHYSPGNGAPNIN